jgi:SOS-response transcriptional repressor LexA
VSAPVISFGDYAPKRAEYSLLLADLPGRSPETIGVLLLDAATDTLHVRLRRDWGEVASPEDAEVLAALEEDLMSHARERGGAAVLDFLENVASQSLRITDREAVSVRNFNKTLGELYREHVSSHVLKFHTHLPRFSLAVAAGRFLTSGVDTVEEGWVETPADLPLNEHMFVAQIRGHSMEPKIPDGSLCVFRHGVVGSRNQRLVLVRNSELADDDQYTVKRYKSEKIVTEEGFRQTRIRLESLNPDYPSWDLDLEEEKYQVIAEFVRVLE